MTAGAAATTAALAGVTRVTTSTTACLTARRVVFRSLILKKEKAKKEITGTD